MQWIHFVCATTERQGHTCVQVSSGCVLSQVARENGISLPRTIAASCAIRVSERPTNCTSVGAWYSLLATFYETGVRFSCHLHGLGTFNYSISNFPHVMTHRSTLTTDTGSSSWSVVSKSQESASVSAVHKRAADKGNRQREVWQGNGPIRHVETCPDFIFTARAHTTKSTVKILAANTHCKYFLKISEQCDYCNLTDPWRNVHP
jgi:hypothetical protein